jgi:hypothetical protein
MKPMPTVIAGAFRGISDENHVVRNKNNVRAFPNQH